MWGGGDDALGFEGFVSRRSSRSYISAITQYDKDRGGRTGTRWFDFEL